MNGDAPVRPINFRNKTSIMLICGLVVILVGLGIGFVASRNKTVNNNPQNEKVIVSATEAGVKDIKTLTDKGIDVKDAIGVLQKDGIKGEGTYNLQRDGGSTHQIALNSTTVDISSFVGKKVQVWGITQASHNASWLMDVVKIKVVE